MRILVTGAGGFLGRYVAERLLERGDEVRGLARRDYPQLKQLGVEMMQGDVRDMDRVLAACDGVEAVVHTAAVAGIWGPRRHFFSINTLGTINVITACQRQQVGRLVYSSSPSVTFGAEDQLGVDESVGYARRWLCHYPHSKAVAEQAVRAANTDELRTCALRPHLIWGPRDPHLIPRLLERARRGQLRRVGEGANLVDMIYVENAADAHLLALDALAAGKAAGHVLFISQGEPVNCWEWINDILQLAQLPSVEKNISFSAAWRAGQVLEWMWRISGRRDEPRMTRFLAAQLAKSHYFDMTAARELLGYEPRVDTQEGMRRLGEWINAGMPP